MSTANLINFLRVSYDTRWQPRSHKADARYVGNIQPTTPNFGVYGKKSSLSDEDKITTNASLKK